MTLTATAPNFHQTVDMLNKAFDVHTNLNGLIFHSDQGWQYQMEPYHTILRGRDIKRYRYAWAGLWLINSHNNPPIDMSNYPAIKEHLDQFYSQLEKRSDKGKTPYNLRNCAYLEEFEKEKIIQPQTVKEQSFCFDNKGIFGDVSMQFWISKNKTANIKLKMTQNLFFICFLPDYFIFHNSMIIHLKETNNP